MLSTAPLVPAIAAGPNSLVVIDPSVSGFQALLDALPADAHVLVLDSRSDAIAQITTALHGLGGAVSSLHIVSHGGDGVLSLGGQRVDAATIAARTADLAVLGQQLAEGADIVLYGCDVAATATGRSFVDALAAATHADAAASTDRTGDAALGGNWVLEYQHGQLETTAVFNGMALAGSGIVLALPNGRQEIVGSPIPPDSTAPTVPTGPDFSAGFHALNGLPGFTLSASEDIDNTANPDPVGFYFGAGNAPTGWFHFQADGTTLGSFDLTGLGFQRFGTDGDFSFTITGYKAAGGTVTTDFSVAIGSSTYSAINYTGFTGLTGFKVDLTRTSATYFGIDQHTFDFFTVANAVEPAFAPTLSTISTLAGGTEDTAYTITYAALLAAADEADANSGDTLSFRVETLSSGTLTKGGTPVTPGSTLLGPGESLVWTPGANANGALGAFTVKAWDGALASAAAVQVTVNVGAVNDTPTNITLSNLSVAENSPTASPLAIGALSTTDVEAGSFTYSIVGGADQGAFAISGSNLQFKAGTVLDFEAKPSYAVTVRSTDAGGQTYDKAFTVNLTNVNEAPTVATPLADQVANAPLPFSFTFASNAFQDPDAATTLVYTAALNGGGALPGWLAFDPNTRTFSGSPATGDAGTLQVKVTATDGGALSTSDVFALVVTNGPVVTSIVRAAAASATVPTAATSVSYTVTFSESVTNVDTSDFTLTATDSASGTVASVTGAGTTYTVVVNSITGDGNLRLDLNGSGTGIVNGSSAPIVSGFSAGEIFSMDHTVPAAPSVPAMSAGTDTGTPADAITTNTTPVFTGSGEANATVKLYDTNGTTVLGTTVADGSGNWSIASSTLSEGAHSLSARQTDAAGNLSAASNGLAVTIDTTAPSVGASSSLPTLKAGDTATITFTFSEDPGASFNWNGTLGDVLVTGGTLSAISGAGLARTATFTPTAGTNGGSASITVSAGSYTDTAGNSGGASTALVVGFDTLAPTAPLAMVLAAGSDSGTAGDNTTNATTPSITGTAEASSTVTLYDTDGTTVLGTTTAAVGGTWSITSNALVQGDHSLTAKATDAAGNTSLASAALVVTIDTTAPAVPSAPALEPASDSGASSTDHTTSVATPTVTGTADAGTTVTLYDTNGTTVLGSTVAAGGAWSITSTALAAGTHTLTTKASDAAGNPSTASLGLAVTIDTTAPVFASATVNGNTLVLAYTESSTLDAAHIPTTGAFSVVAAAVPDAVLAVAVDAAARTVTLTLATPVTDGQAVTVAYADPTAGDDTPAIQDIAGNDAATLAATVVTNTTPAPDPGPGTPPTVDGVPVTTAPGPDGSTVVTIPVVLASRPDNPGTPSSLADIPLVKAPDGHTILEVSVPTGVGLQAQGLPTSTTGAAAQAALGAGIERVNGNTPELATAGQAFLATLAPNEALTVQTLKPTTGAGYNPAVPLVISGSAHPADGKQAIILDARSLPSGTIIEVDNIDFIVVVGNVRLVGGAGQNVASGDGSTQWIVLGPDDDVIHGGGGNDTVGSEGGNDQVYGDAGDDIVFGGAGNDLLSGGTGSDRLNGGTGFDVALQEGKRTDYTITLDGAGIKLTHTASGVSDWLVDVEQVRFATGPSLTVAHSAAEEAGAYLFQKWVGRDLSQAEGAIIQTLTGKTALEVATLFAQVFPQQSAGKTPAQLLEGMADTGAVRVDAIRDVTAAGDAGNNTITPTLGLARYVDGGAGIDTVVIPATLAQTHIQANGNGMFTLQRMTDGAMLDLTSVERINLNDTQLALDLNGHAGEAARLLGALGGPAILANKGLVGEVIRALDAGASAQSLAGLGLQALGAQTPSQVVQLLWTNVVGRAGTAQELQPLVNLMGQGVTGSELAVMAGNLDLNATHIDLIGLTAKGIEFA